MNEALLPAVWFAVLGFILVLYTMLDGFDLGVGILALFIRDERMRGLLMGSLGSIWDANETWLILFGGIIFGAFPMVYGLVLSALYLPLAVMLLALIFRAVSFEFRVHSRSKRTWSAAFGLGSLCAALSQGFAFGGLLWGIRIDDGKFVGGIFDWLNPFSIIMALATAAGYAMVGSTYIIMKAGGSLREKARRSALVGAGIAAVCSIVETVLAVGKNHSLMEKWTTLPGALVTVLPFILAGISVLVMLMGILRNRDHLPFACALCFALFGFAALSANYFPVIVPPGLTIYQAAAQPLVLRTMLVAIGLAIPVLLAYNVYQYWVFRGKVTKNVYEEE